MSAQYRIAATGPGSGAVVAWALLSASLAFAAEAPSGHGAPPPASRAEVAAAAQPAAAAPAATPPAGARAAGPAARGPATRAVDHLELDATQITGNRELPKVMVIVPWKRSDIGELVGKPANSLIDEALQPVDREVFRRRVDYYGALGPGRPRDVTAVTNGARPATGGGAAARAEN